jgi:hypothetical protein
LVLVSSFRGKSGQGELSPDFFISLANENLLIIYRNIAALLMQSGAGRGNPFHRFFLCGI